MKLAMKPTPPRVQAEALSRHPDFDRGPRKAVHILLATTALFFVLLFAWMSFAALDISVNAQGAVIPSSRVQQIQSMEGGILQALQARDGAQVKKGDVLWEQIRQFRRSGGAVFLSTHYLEEAEALCDRIGVLHQGSLAGVTRPADGLRLDNGLEVAQFFRQAVEPAPCASP